MRVTKGMLKVATPVIVLGAGLVAWGGETLFASPEPMTEGQPYINELIKQTDKAGRGGEFDPSHFVAGHVVTRNAIEIDAGVTTMVEKMHTADAPARSLGYCAMAARAGLLSNPDAGPVRKAVHDAFRDHSFAEPGPDAATWYAAQGQNCHTILAELLPAAGIALPLPQAPKQ